MKFEIVIVGSGLGGLVCGCYLAREGFRVLIVEKNEKVGGFCSSFNRNGFVFDAGPHSLGSCRKSGYLGSIIRELGINSKVDIRRTDPSDLIITPKHTVRFWSDSSRTLKELQAAFPVESVSLKRWFDFVTKPSVTTLYKQLFGMSMDELLSKFFKDRTLRGLLSVPIENLGEPPTRASAWSSVLVLREHIFDGGYYPRGGMQQFSNAFRDIFEESGGEILLNSQVKKIQVKNGKVVGVALSTGKAVEAKAVVSNIDLFEISRLLDNNKANYPQLIRSKLSNKSMRFGTSAVVGYFGFNGEMDSPIKDCSSFWFCRTDRLMDRANLTTTELKSTSEIRADIPLLCSMPSAHDKSLSPIGASSLYTFLNCEVSDSIDDKIDTNSVRNKLINLVEHLLPGFKSKLVLAELALPKTFVKYNLCSGGSIRGWACSADQDLSTPIRQGFPVHGLFYVGHWASRIGPGGVAMAVLSGKRIARMIISMREKKRCFEGSK